MSEAATCRWHNAAALLSRVSSLSAPLKCGLNVGHTCLMKETEWSRTIGACGGVINVMDRHAELAATYRSATI